jgi:hypothetical protein
MPDEADKAAKHMNDGELDGQFLKVKVSVRSLSFGPLSTSYITCSSPALFIPLLPNHLDILHISARRPRRAALTADIRPCHNHQIPISTSSSSHPLTLSHSTPSFTHLFPFSLSSTWSGFRAWRTRRLSTSITLSSWIPWSSSRIRRWR